MFIYFIEFFIFFTIPITPSATSGSALHKQKMKKINIWKKIKSGGKYKLNDVVLLTFVIIKLIIHCLNYLFLNVSSKIFAFS